jgi:hypothetical protein
MQAFWTSPGCGYLIVVILFVFLAVFTRSPVQNDTFFYVDDIDSSIQCPNWRDCPQIWDVAHLLWRPIGHVFLLPLIPIVRPFVNVSDSTSILLFLKTLSGSAILLGACFLYAILAEHTTNALVSLFVTAGFMCACANLYALHSGTSYSAGLGCLMTAIWCAGRRDQSDDMRFAAMAGVFGALSVTFWLPYIVALPALLCWLLLNRQVRRLEAAGIMIFFAALVSGFLFSLGAHFYGVGSIRDLFRWVANSGHGTKQTHNLVRSLFGLPRSFLDFGQFGFRMKQFLLKDPYAKVRLTELFGEAIWKMLLFYFTLFGLLFLYRDAKGRKAIVVLATALVANMVLAVAFEGGSPERYLPLYPFLFIAAAYCLSIQGIPRAARNCVILLLLVMIVGNLPPSSIWNIRAEQKKLAARITSLPSIPPQSVLFLVGDDPVSHLRQITAIDELDRLPSLQISGVFVPLMNSATWRHDFAVKVLSTWRDGGSTLVTMRVWSEEPKRQWNWAEGDDPNIRWRDVVRFFGPLDHVPAATTEDGFAFLTHSTTNEVVLKSYADDPKQNGGKNE